MRARQYQKRHYQRWFQNFGLGSLNALIVYVMIPAGSVGAAISFEAHNIGLYHAIEDTPILDKIYYFPIIYGTLCFLIMDVWVYAQHVMFHKIPLLWRIHRTHHMDEELDTSSGIRFHPLEALISITLKIAMIAILGAPVISVILFELALSCGSLFTHANIRLKPQLNRLVKYICVTPQMHVIHHSIIKKESMKNYGFFLSFWDRIFKTYLEETHQSNPGSIKLGVTGDKDQSDKNSLTANFKKLILNPFQK
jgi:sterol desaturase/sphingolipid hydroxylase (fatty acid hydroxylase superfamily)